MKLSVIHENFVLQLLNEIEILHKIGFYAIECLALTAFTYSTSFDILPTFRGIDEIAVQGRNDHRTVVQLQNFSIWCFGD